MASKSKSYAELRDELAETQRTFLETELSLAAVFAEMAKQPYRDGDPQEGDQSKGHAETALKTVRYFVVTINLLTRSEIDLLIKRCDELERIVATLGPAK
jgi:hypothetical protein